MFRRPHGADGGSHKAPIPGLRHGRNQTSQEPPYSISATVLMILSWSLKWRPFHWFQQVRPFEQLKRAGANHQQ
jgi:hypothetical protein